MAITRDSAAFDTLPMLKLLEEKLASPSPRMLHVAAEEAAAKGADPNNASPVDSVQKLRYLVNKCQMDVNASDINVLTEAMITPCAWARRLDGVSVVR